jgi:superfamily I DNA/RNA helicase
MNSKEIEITHDFYLKKFQLSRPNLNFDYILFDEGQDASPAMLDVFINQKATKVIVGDTHQQIYGWRYAVNSLEKVDFESFNLSNSFRFRQEIADLASQSLILKNEISDIAVTTTLVGQGNSTDTLSRAVIARSNLGLLLNAIKMVYEEQSIDSLYFEGNINSYTYADEGASLYDVLNLRNQEHSKIKDVLIKSMRDLDDLEDYIKKTEDVQLGMLLEIVNEYGNEIPKIIKTLKLKHVENHLRDSAEVIFSTVHRCKGMEYDDVYLVDDFITKEKIASLPEDYFSEEKNIEKTNEEINLLYVAITRTRNILRIPLDMVPDDFELSERIKLTDRDTSEDEEQALEATQTIETKEQTETLKSYSFEEVRKTHTEAYQLWTEELDFELTTMFCGKVSISAMAIHFGRTRGAISSRIKKLELEEKYG